MEIKEYYNTPLTEAELPHGDKIYPEAESGMNICLYQLNKSGLPVDMVLFGNVTVGQLKKALESARNSIDIAKFELGENF